ncbi:MAG: S8 family serine peptidase [Williamsia sp.]|nr:S8 family serine peptidase [Williamsia sp.]
MKKIVLPCRRPEVFIAWASILLFSCCKKELDKGPSRSSGISRELSTLLLQHPEKYVAHQLIVRFKPGLTRAAKTQVLSLIQASIAETILTPAMQAAGDQEGIQVITTSATVLDALAGLQQLPPIAWAEPNFIYYRALASNDTYFTNGSLWGMYGDNSSPANPYGSQAAEAWAAGHTGSAAVAVGIVDEGIQYTHTDLNGQVWTNPYDPVNGIDDDKNGYIDDTHGWDFISNSNSIWDSGSSNTLEDAHGTHVAGTIGAKAGNKTGVAGINWNITLVACKFLGSNGGTTANAIKAIDYLTDLKTRHGIRIAASNNSWGGGGYSQALFDAITRSNNSNILFITAAGNGGNDGAGANNDVTANYPANYTVANVISVAAIDKTGKLASFSNWGANTVDICAPGVSIYSTVPTNSYASYSGTSMATPHVSGAAALYASTHPNASAAAIKNAILGSAIKTSLLSGKCATGGRLDISDF